MDTARMSREELLAEVLRLQAECERLTRAVRPVHETLKAALESEQRCQEARRALAASESRFRALTTAAQDAIFCKDCTRRYTFANPYMLSMLKLEEHEVIGRTPEELYDPQSAAVVRAVDDRSFAGELVNAVRTMQAGGKTYRLHTIQFPLRDAAGSIIGIGGIVRDEEIVPEK